MVLSYEFRIIRKHIGLKQKLKKLVVYNFSWVVAFIKELLSFSTYCSFQNLTFKNIIVLLLGIDCFTLTGRQLAKCKYSIFVSFFTCIVVFKIP